MSNPPKEWWAEFAARHGELHKAVGDLTRVLHRMTPDVAATITYVLDANGQATGQFRLPYACLTVDSQSAKVLTVVSQPLGTQPPAGPGVGFVRAGGYAVLNISGYSWSIYGGNPGDVVTVAAYGNPQAPYAR